MYVKFILFCTINLAVYGKNNKKYCYLFEFDDR